jgi:hypothetical protein
MSAVWITRVINNSDQDITMDFLDRTWRPVNPDSGVRFAVGEPLLFPARTAAGQPTIVNLQYAFVGWAGWSKTTVQGPTGTVDLVVGPNDFTDQDYLKVLGPAEEVLASRCHAAHGAEDGLPGQSCTSCSTKPPRGWRSGTTTGWAPTSCGASMSWPPGS